MANNTEEIILNVDVGNPYYVGARAYVTQTENGAILTVIDKEGTTTAVILNGAKGDKGDTGETGATGATGNGISTATLNDDYTLTLLYTDGTSTTTAPIRGERGNSIQSVEKTGTDGLVDEYTITFDDETTNTFYVTNGERGFSVLKVSTQPTAASHTTLPVSFKLPLDTVLSESGADRVLVGDTILATYTFLSKPRSNMYKVLLVSGNNVYLSNAVSIKGETGDKGDTGETGATGATGATPQLSIGTVETTAEPSVTITGTDEEPVLNFGLVKGGKGDQGDVSTEQLNEAIENGVTAGTNGLVSDSKITEKVPYQFRPTADGVRVGNIAYDKLVGGTVAWNQLVPNNYSHDADALVAFNSGTSIVEGHKYFISRKLSASQNVGIYVYARVSGANKTCFSITGTDTATIKASAYSGTSIGSTASTEGNIWIYQANNSSVVTVTDFNIFDLTQMFGSTIADAIYAMERATAGSGVAWFRKLFPKPYYAYNAGELKSVSGVSAHNMTGFNQFDKSSAESGKWFNNEYGNITNVVGYILSDYIKIFPNTTYYCKPTGSVRALYFDANKNLFNAGTWANIAANGGTFTTPSGVAYVRCSIQDSKIDDFCINLSWDGERDGEYEPYIKHSYPLDDSLTLRGIPKLDSSNNLYYDGDTYESDGTVTRKYGVVDLGTLSYYYDSTNQRFTSAITEKANGWDNIIAPKYARPISKESYDFGDMSIKGGASSNTIYIKDTNYNDATALKTALSGVYAVYELATPTTESADPYTNPQIIDDFGTEEYVSTSIVPVGHKTQYSQDLKGKIEQLPWDFSTLIAPTETTDKASRNYTSGSLLIMNNILYKATANIQNGGTITPNTNVTATTLAEVIASL